MLRLQRKMARTPSENVCGPKSFPSNDFQTQTDSGQSATCINPPASPAHAGLAPLIFRPRRSDPVASLSHFSGPQQQQQKRRLFLRPSEPSVVRWETKRRSQNVSGNEQIYFYIIQGILRKAREPACTHVSSPCSKLRNIFTVHRKATPCHSSGEFTVDKSRQHVRLKREVSDTLPIRAARAEAPPVGIPARKAPIMGLRPEQKARLAIEERLQQSIILVGWIGVLSPTSCNKTEKRPRRGQNSNEEGTWQTGDHPAADHRAHAFGGREFRGRKRRCPGGLRLVYYLSATCGIEAESQI